MGRKGLSAVLVVAGLGLMALAVAADVIGLGAGDYAFGWEQKLGVAVGMTVAWFATLQLFGWRPSGTRQQVEPVRDITPASGTVRAAA